MVQRLYYLLFCLICFPKKKPFNTYHSINILNVYHFGTVEVILFINELDGDFAPNNLGVQFILPQ